VAPVLHDLAEARDALGEHAEARALHQRALAVRELTLAPDNPLIATSAGERRHRAASPSAT
jgi:hypothetical protein